MAEEPENPQDEQPPADEQAPEPEAPAEGQPAPDAEPSPEPEGPIHEASAEEAAAPAEEPAADAEASAEEPAAEEPATEEPAAEAPAAEAPASADQPARPKPEIPGADLEVDIVPEGMDPLTRANAEEAAALAAVEDVEAPVAEEPAAEADEDEVARPVAEVAIDLASGARYRATGKRKTAVARVILKPGKGAYSINGRPLETHFPRPTLQRNIRQPLETVGYEARMDVVATLHGGGVSAQAGALRHGISRALIEADPNLRSELKRRGFLTRDPRVKERKKAGLKKARKRPQFSKR
jgi:small subunit ribosomal protein S9